MIAQTSKLTPTWTWRLLISTVVVFGVYFGLYATVSGANVAYLAWFAHVPMIEKFFAGTWGWHDAIQRFGEHGLFGYNLLLLVNLNYFQLNVFFDIYLNVMVVTGIGLIVAAAYNRVDVGRGGAMPAVVLFVPVALALFSVTQQSSGAMETQVRLGTLFYLAAAYWIDRTLFHSQSTAGKGTMLTGVVLITLAVLVFGTLYTFAGFPALMVLCLYTAVTRSGMRNYATIIMAALVVSIPAYIRFYDLKLEASAGVSMGLLERLSFSIQFVASYLGSATLGRTLWEDKITTSDALMFWNGLFVSAAYLFSIWLFWRSRMYRITWLPVLLIAYTVGAGLLILIGRGPMFGWDGGTNYWYAVHVKFALAGCLWIYAHALLGAHSGQNEAEKPLHSRLSIALPLIGIMVVFSICMVISNYFDWKRAPHVRRYYEAMIPHGLAALDEMPVDAHGQTPFRASPLETKHALRVFREHGLTFYSSHKLPVGQREHDIFVQGDATKYARLGPGWHDSEGSTRWVSGRAQIQFHSGTAGVVTIEGYIPPMLAPNSILLSIEGREVASQPLSEGVFSVTTGIPPSSLLTLTIVFKKHLVPRTVGLNDDQRDLGAILTRITTR